MTCINISSLSTSLRKREDEQSHYIGLRTYTNVEARSEYQKHGIQQAT